MGGARRRIPPPVPSSSPSLPCDAVCDIVGKPEWKEDPEGAKPANRLPKLGEVFGTIGELTRTKTKFEVIDMSNPAGPILR